MEKLCGITMQLSLFELKLKTFPLLRRSDHLFPRVSFSSKYPEEVSHIIIFRVAPYSAWYLTNGDYIK